MPVILISQISVAQELFAIIIVEFIGVLYPRTTIIRTSPGYLGAIAIYRNTDH